MGGKQPYTSSIIYDCFLKFLRAHVVLMKLNSYSA